ncbi:MAG: acyltransferase family protein [Halomonas venusta]|nr:acyltransferase family protein [Halomonas venusta]
MLFRQDINALRALAVAFVMLFHFKVTGFSGGFIGVDVFFVLSGYLMTGIIATALGRNSFNLWDFYHARARRIVPALAVLCIALLVFGFIYLPTGEYRSLIREIKTSLLFYSNIDLAAAGGYFDTPPSEHWLLHTWSLSVEWQFYLLYPIALLGLYKFAGKRGLLPGVIAACVLSFAWSVYITPHSANNAFYMLQSRAFELLAGAVVFLRPVQLSKNIGRALQLAGFALIIVCGSMMDETLAWPGHLALLPVLGAVLILVGENELKLFSFAPIRYLGSISYSAYLWHWPVVVVLYFCGLLSSPVWVVIGVVFSLVCASLSYHFVESRFKKSPRPAKSLALYFAVTVVLVGASAALASVVKRHPEIRPSSLEQGQPTYTSTLYEQQCAANPYGAADCVLGNGDLKVILFGDSHAQSNAAAVQMENTGSALGWALGGCPLLVDFTVRNKDIQDRCKEFNSEKLEILNSSHEGIPVILFNYYALYFDVAKNSDSYVSAVNQPGSSSLRDSYTKQYESIVCEIAETHPVYLVMPTPRMPFGVYKGAELQRRLFNSDRDIAIPLEEHLHVNADAIAMIEQVANSCNAAIIDQTPLLCPYGYCLGTSDGVPLYFDDNHLVDAGNIKMKGLFKEVFYQN